MSVIRWPPAYDWKPVASCKWLNKFEGGLFDITERILVLNKFILTFWMRSSNFFVLFIAFFVYFSKNIDQMRKWMPWTNSASFFVLGTCIVKNWTNSLPKFTANFTDFVLSTKICKRNYMYWCHLFCCRIYLGRHVGIEIWSARSCTSEVILCSHCKKSFCSKKLIKAYKLICQIEF